MSDFNQVQATYIAAKNNLSTARNDAYRARQQYLLKEREVANLLHDQRLVVLPQGHALAAALNTAQKTLEDKRGALAKATTTAETARKQFEQFAEMRIAVSNLDNNTPVLLLPLRLQTRYQIIKHIARNCPPALLVDFNKITNAATKLEIRKHLPILTPKADPMAGVSSQAHLLSNLETPQVKNLIATLNNSPTGLKRWQKTEDKYELWVRFFPDEIFLQTHETALTESEIKSGINFWNAMLVAQKPGTTDVKARQITAWEQLQAGFTAARAAWIARAMRPDNFPEKELPTGKTLNFPGTDRKSDAWTIPPRTDLLPERIAIRLFFKNGGIREVTGNPVPDTLQLGFDPDEQDETAFSTRETSLELPAAIRWLTDFDEAEKIGMAVRIPLSKAEFSGGIAKMVALGVKTGADPAEGSKLMEQLFENHRFKTNGMAFLPHGTPTNNLPGQPSGFSTTGLPAAATFENEFPGVIAPDDKSDGRRLATALGLSASAFDGVFNHNRREAEEALLINRALWPGTMGYFLDQLMRPAVNDADIASAKTFFQNFVTGRGLLPPFRVGKQPYGIIPATVWSSWQPGKTASPEEKRLVAFLKKLNAEWAKIAEQVKTISMVFEQNAGKEETLKREFRQILSCQASSTRFFRRLIAGEYLLWNLRINVDPSGEKTGIKTDPKAYLNLLQGANGWGQTLATKPRMLGRFLEDERYKLTDFQHDTLAGTNDTNDSGENYLFILLDATADQLRDGTFGDNFTKFVKHKSSVLMFNLARFSLLQEWMSASTAMLRKEKPLISPFARLDFELEYLNSDTKPSQEHQDMLNASPKKTYETRKNKWAFWEEKLANGKTVKANIETQLKSVLSADQPVKALQESLEALDALKSVPDEQLERLMTEHIDLCSFRLDAWLQGLVLARLSAQRAQPASRQGIFIGAYGYLENLNPDAEPWVKIVEVAEPVAVVAKTAPPESLVMPVYDFSAYTAKQQELVRYVMFVYLGSDPNTRIVQQPLLQTLMQSRASGQVSDDGFLLTPSLEHATTAAILRAGYEHHARAQGPESSSLAVNLDSERTGRALDMLKAVQAGHSLNEQLGYFIERKLYETPALAPLVPGIRAKFPLHIENQEWDNTQQAGATTNLSLVLDGLELLQEKNKAGASTAVSFKWNQVIPAANRPAVAGIVKQAEQLFDAVSDLLLAESVFQTVKGSPERAAAALRATSEGIVTTLPEIARIPGEGRTLTHRMGFALHPGPTDATAWPVSAGQSPSVAALLSPELNRWLADQLPAPDRIFSTITDANGQTVKVSLAALGLQPVDFFTFLQKAGGKPEQSPLAFLVLEKSLKTANTNTKTLQAVGFQRNDTFTEQEYAVGELIAIIHNLKRLLENSRPMRPEDWTSAPKSVQQIPAPLDNSALLQTVTRITDTSPGGPVPAFLKKLESAAADLRANPPFGIDTTNAEAAFAILYRLLPQAWALGIWDALPVCPNECNSENTRLLLEKADHTTQTLKSRLDLSTKMLGEIKAQPATTDSGKQFDKLVQLARIFAGDDFLLLPRFKLTNPPEIKSTFEDKTLLDSAGEFAVEEWLQGLAVVRDGPRQYQMLCNLREAIPGPAAGRQFKIMQIPFIPGHKNVWIGGRFPEGFTPPEGIISLAFECPAAFSPTQLIAGIVLDDWREKLPLPELTAGVSINYNQPNNEAPQTLLLVVSPNQQSQWQWEHLIGAVLETVDLSRKRLIDTDMLQGTWLNQFLPALVAPVDLLKNTPTLNFSVAGPPVTDFGAGPGTGGVGGGVKK